MINFAQYSYLYLLILIPFFFLLYGFFRRQRRKRVEAFGDPALVNSLMPRVSKRKGWVKLVFFSLAFFFFVIGLARPQLGASLKEQEVKGAEIMIALDVSNSMLAEDYSPNRLERAKLAISKLVDRLKEDRIGLIVFAGQSFVQLPITTDYVSAKIFLNTITTESVPVQGTSLGDAIETSFKSFSQESGESRAIILITDGENHEDDPITAAKHAVEVGARVFCVGVGSNEGKPIPMNGELLKDKNGNIVVTKLDEATLRDVAEAGNGIYVRAGNSEFGLNPIIDEIRNMEAQKYKSVVFEDYDEQFMYFFGIALFFLLLELCIGSNRNNRSLFSSSKTLLIVLMLTLPAFSAMAQIDKSEVRKGNKLFKKGEFQKSEIEYKRALVKDSTSLKANYNLGNTLYRLENFEEAQKYLVKIKDSLTNLPLEQQAALYHNLGDTYVKQKKYQEAVDAFKESLRRFPTDIETKKNLAYAQKMLENQQQQQQQQQNQDDNKDQNKDQNKDNKDQNKDQNKDNKDQNKDQNQNQDPKQDPNKDKKKDKGGAQPKISPQAAQQMIKAIEDKEKETQEKVKKEKAQRLKSKQKEKNW